MEEKEQYKQTAQLLQDWAAVMTDTTDEMASVYTRLLSILAQHPGMGWREVIAQAVTSAGQVAYSLPASESDRYTAWRLLAWVSTDVSMLDAAQVYVSLLGTLAQHPGMGWRDVVILSILER